jgi:hypothetical protein
VFPWNEFDNILFERGLSLQKQPDGSWSHGSGSLARAVPFPESVQHQLGVRPIIASGPCGNERVDLVLPSTYGRLLDIYLSELNSRLPRAMLFVMGAMLYHCKTLARLYAEECRRHSSRWPGYMADGTTPPWAEAQNVVITPHEHFFEFEALMTAIVRGYEYLRFPLWARYGQGSSTPRNFSEVLKKVRLPITIAKRLCHSHNSYYKRAKKYRDCIQHNVDMGSSSWAMMERLDQSIWSILVRIPDNPDSKSRSKFIFHQKLDALTLG